MGCLYGVFFFFSSRRRHTRLQGDWSSDVCSSDLGTRILTSPWAPTVKGWTECAMRERSTVGMPSLSKRPLTTIASAWAQRCTSVSARSSGGGNFDGNGMTRPRLAMAGAQYNAGAMPVKVGVVGDYDPGSRAHRATDAALAHAAGASSLAVDVRWVPTE